MAEKKDNLEDALADALKKFDKSWNYAKKNHHKRWLRNWKLDNSIRTDVGYQGITNTFVPMSGGTIHIP